jgi:hypothetical protein
MVNIQNIGDMEDVEDGDSNFVEWYYSWIWNLFCDYLWGCLCGCRDILLNQKERDIAAPLVQIYSSFAG